MLLDFNHMPEESFPHFKNGDGSLEGNMFFDGPNRIRPGRLTPGSSIGLHKHEGNCEIIYVLSGHGKMHYDGTIEELDPGMCTYCPEGHQHMLVNEGPEDLVFFAVVPKQ